jgi:hypothetical protein
MLAEMVKLVNVGWRELRLVCYGYSARTCRQPCLRITGRKRGDGPGRTWRQGRGSPPNAMQTCIGKEIYDSSHRLVLYRSF